MKFIALALLVLSFNSFGATLKKTFDGASARCEEMSEVGLRAYNLEVVKEVQSAKSTSLTFKVNFYKCAEVPSGYGLRASSANEVLSSFILLPNGKIGMTKNTLTKAVFYAQTPAGMNVAVGEMKRVGNESFVTLTLPKETKRVFIDADMTSDITSEIGNLKDNVQKYGGFVLSL